MLKVNIYSTFQGKTLNNVERRIHAYEFFIQCPLCKSTFKDYKKFQFLRIFLVITINEYPKLVVVVTVLFGTADTLLNT